jgi:ribosomal protein L7/L12
MSVTITCEVSDIKEFVQDRVDQAERIGTLQSKADRVYDMEDNLRNAKDELAKAIRPQPIPVRPTQVTALILAVRDGQKITAVKEVRSMTGLGLKEAKDLVENALGLIG